jgi:hypothetical protein
MLSVYVCEAPIYILIPEPVFVILVLYIMVPEPISTFEFNNHNCVKFKRNMREKRGKCIILELLKQ